MNEPDWIKEIRERREKASEDPWVRYHDDYIAGTSLISTSPVNSDATVIADSIASPDDANFLAHSWVDVGRLLDEVAKPPDCKCACHDDPKHTTVQDWAEANRYHVAKLKDATAEIERLRAENAEVIQFVSGLRNTGHGWPTRDEVVAALRSRQTERK